MARMVQIRHVPEELHRLLKVRAAAAGLSLSDYLLQELAEVADKPSLPELFGQIERGAPVGAEGDAIVQAIREQRDERDRRTTRAGGRRR